jgi:hypothetical protein
MSIRAEAAFFCLAFSYAEQYRKAQPPEGAAPFHPICRIEHFDARVVPAGAQSCNQPAHFLGGKNPLDLALLLIGKRPEALAQRNRGVGVLETLFRQMIPRPLDRLTHYNLDALRTPAAQVRVGVRERFLVPLHHLLEYLGVGYARQVGPAGSRRKRQSEADEVVRGMPITV